jgi:hypothetical protein
MNALVAFVELSVELPPSGSVMASSITCVVDPKISSATTVAPANSSTIAVLLAIVA